MSEIKEAQEISNPNDNVSEQVCFDVNEYEVIDALLVTGKEQTKKYTVYPVLD
jgi:hypothetical protein